MDPERFDALSRAFSTTRSRRTLIRLLGGLSLGGVLSSLSVREAAAGSRIGGAPCERDTQCATGNCLGNNTCSCSREFKRCKQPTDPCQKAVCNVETGRCVNRDKCKRQAPESCGRTGGCTEGTCELYGAETVCREASCTNGVETQEASCDGTGTCPAAVTRNCNEGYQCHETVPVCLGPGGCGGPGDCTSTHFCEGGLCKPKKANGESCANGTQCLSSFCSPADHICCGTRCDEIGQSCPGGTCSG